MSKKEQGKAPVLRFKGFIDDWEQRKWKDILLVNSGKDYKHLSRGSIPVYGTGGYMLSVDKELSNVDAIGIGRKGTIDHPQYLKAPFWTVDTLFFMTPKNDINIDFAFGLSQTINWKKYDESTGLPSLSKKSIDNISIKLPNYNEQIKIGRIISQIDNVISLQQRKLDELDQLKKGTQQRLIVNNAIPQIRFNKFSGSWVRRKLNEITNYRNGKAHEKVINSNGKYIVINSKFISSNGTIIKHTDKNLSPLQKNDITFVLSDVPNGKALAKTYLVPFNNVYSLNQRIAAIKASNETDPYFLYFLLNRNEYFLRFDDHVGQTNLSKSDILSFTNFYPGLKEQQTIGKLLKITHERIINEKTKIVELRVLKEFLLQKLFI